MITRRFAVAGAATAAAVLCVSRGWATSESAKDSFEITMTEEGWRQKLDPQQYHVMREHGTERAGTSPLDKVYAPGTYGCVACDLPLFSSTTKFNSRTGWPSFWDPIKDAKGYSVGRTSDKSIPFMVRTEVHCRRCGGHLGHVFDDGPKPTGLRYCINGVALKFVPQATG